ncbi:unnamed protein product [Prunus armeniaca]
MIKVLDFKTLLDVLCAHTPPVSVSKLPPKVFGCIAYVHVYSHQQSKLDPCALCCVFIGYSTTQKNYKCYHPPSQKGERESELKNFRMENLRCIEASEGISDGVLTTGRQAICEKSTGRVEDDDRSHSTKRDDCVETTGRPEDEIGRLAICAKSTGCPEGDDRSLVEFLDEICHLPEECDSDICDSCEDEIDIRSPSALAPSQSTRDDDEHKADDSIDHYKARLVAKGYTKTYGVDYTETFAPVAKLNTVRVLLSLATNHDWPMLQFDVKNAFLHGDLKEEIYMDPSPGIPVTSKEGMVCKLRKSLYGLKQSPRAWFGRFAASMRKSGYVQSNSDHTLFLKVTKVEIQSLQKYLASEFEMKSLGDLKYFLGIEVARSKHGIFLSQRKYVLDLLAEIGMLDCKPIDTPSEQNHKLGLYPDQVPTDKERYQRLVGKLIYLAHTRPDIAYASFSYPEGLWEFRLYRCVEHGEMSP